MAEGTRCHRFPCDTAHRRGTHKLVDGLQHHVVSVGSETVDVGELVQAWRVQVFAAGDGPWQVLVDVHPWAETPQTLMFTPGTAEPGAWARGPPRGVRVGAPPGQRVGAQVQDEARPRD